MTKETVLMPKGAFLISASVSASVVQAPAAQASCTSGFPDSKEVKLEEIAEESNSPRRVSLRSQSHSHKETRGCPTHWLLKEKVAPGGASPPMGRQHPSSQDACLCGSLHSVLGHIEAGLSLGEPWFPGAGGPSLDLTVAKVDRTWCLKVRVMVTYRFTNLG